MSLPLPSVLVVDDEKNMRRSLQTMLGDEGYAVRAAESAEDALSLLAQETFLMVITDARLGGMSGYDFLAKISQQWPDLPSLMITAYATPKLAVEAIKAGAMDYLSKPFEPEELFHAVARCAERFRLLRENEALRSRAGEAFTLDQIVGESPKMRELRQLIRTVAVTDARVLILGESGTGKELVAGALHSLSRRRNENYVRINCAAIPETLLESELFGHEKGSFTGALKQKPGRVEEADGGTIFLDEIADMGRPLQAKLLRFLEDGTFTRVGGIEELARERAAGGGDQPRHRAGHRRRGISRGFVSPAQRGAVQPAAFARARRRYAAAGRTFFEDFPDCAGEKHHRFYRPPPRQKLLDHHWPGNVRELRNVVERALILETGREIQPSSLPDFTSEQRLQKGGPRAGRDGRIPGSRAGTRGTRIDPKRAGAE